MVDMYCRNKKHKGRSVMKLFGPDNEQYCPVCSEDGAGRLPQLEDALPYVDKYNEYVRKRKLSREPDENGKYGVVVSRTEAQKSFPVLERPFKRMELVYIIPSLIKSSKAKEPKKSIWDGIFWFNLETGEIDYKGKLEEEL